MKNEAAILELAQEVFRRKDERRRALAALSFEEKIEVLVRLQQLASEISLAVRGHARQPWSQELADGGSRGRTA